MRDEIIQKALKGEMTEEEKGTLTDDEKAEIVKQRDDVVGKVLGEISGLRKERDRVDTQVLDKKKELETTDTQLTQFRSEQIEKAKERFTKEFAPSAEDAVRIFEIFAKLDSGKVDADLIYRDIRSSYAAANPEKFLESDTKLRKMEQNAHAAILDGAGSQSAPPAGGQEQKPFSDNVMTLSKAAGITPEAAKKVVEEGMVRTFS